MVGLNGLGLAVGYALSTFMGLAFYFVKEPQAQWRAPLGLALIWPIIISTVCCFIPESPRFLLMKGRIDEARAVVFKIHSSSKDVDQEFVRSEFYQMCKQAELDKELPSSYVRDFQRFLKATR